MKTRPGRPPTTSPKNGHLKNRSFEAASLPFRRTAGRNSSFFGACPCYSLKNEWWVDGVPMLRPRAIPKRKIWSLHMSRTVFIFNNNMQYNYKDSIFYKNDKYLEYLYIIRFYIRSIICCVLHVDTEYNNNTKRKLMHQLKVFYFVGIGLNMVLQKSKF